MTKDYPAMRVAGLALAAIMIVYASPPAPTSFAADCNGNGIDDVCDISCGEVGGPCDIPGCGSSLDCNANGIPDACDVTTSQQVIKLTASDAAAEDNFGYSVSVSGDVAVVGARWDDDGGSRSGSAYVYRFEGGAWVETAKLTASNAEADDYFGEAVAVSGDVALIGAPGNDDISFLAGAAYVFRYNGSNWIEEAKLTASDAAAGDMFGFSAAINGDRAIVGARWNDDAGSNSGSAYVFRFNGTHWIEEAKLTASNAAAGDDFGTSVSISGEVAIVGAPDNDAAGSNAGSAYIFRFSGADWVEQAMLNASDAAAEDLFGESVSISGEAAIVGARLDDDAGTSSGSAYIFRFNGVNWVEEAKLTASDGAAFDAFGDHVAIDGDAAVVSTPYASIAGVSGAAYVFLFNGSQWFERIKLVPSDPANGDAFGESVSISGAVVLVGAYGNDDAGSNSGSAYVFGPASADCDGDSVPDECEPDSDGDDIIDDCDNCPDDPNADQADADHDGVGDACDDCPGTVPGSPVDAQGCPPEIPGDFTGDGDVDQDDLSIFESCASGPGIPHPGSPICQKADADNDGDVDQEDFAVIQCCYSGQDIPANPNCKD